MYHTGQECRFVLKVADAETFQTSDTTPADGVCAVGAISIGLSLEFRIVPTGQAKLQRLFKQKLAERGLKGRVRANQSGCLDQCEHGPNIVVYPEAVWYGRVTEADVDEIIDSHIVGGKPVERLVLAPDCVNTPTCEHRARRE